MQRYHKKLHCKFRIEEIHFENKGMNDVNMMDLNFRTM